MCSSWSASRGCCSLEVRGAGATRPPQEARKEGPGQVEQGTDSAPSSPCHAHRDPLPECLCILRQARGIASWCREGHGGIAREPLDRTDSVVRLPLQAGQRCTLRRSFLLPSHNLSSLAPISRLLKNPLSPRLLKKVQMSLDFARDRESFDRLRTPSRPEGPAERQAARAGRGTFAGGSRRTFGTPQRVPERANAAVAAYAFGASGCGGGTGGCRPGCSMTRMVFHFPLLNRR